MNGMRYHSWCSAGALALLLAGVPAVAAAQDAARPEWQQYDELDDRFGPLAWLTFGEVIGAEVTDEQGQPVGEIVSLVRATADGMFHAVMDGDDADSVGDRVVPVDHLEVIGDSQETRQIVLVGEPPTDFDAADYEPAPPGEG